MTGTPISFTDLSKSIRQCRLCEAHLQPRPVVWGSSQAKLLIVGQAPGIKVHRSGIPWDDASGERLRQWLQLTKPAFYDESNIAIVPMGFCYPGKGKSGDLPPRPECAETWHRPLLETLPKVALTLLIGNYAQGYYLGDRRPLTERVQNFRDYPSHYFPLPHPSPRNNIWLKRNPWFDRDVLPQLQQRLHRLSV